MFELIVCAVILVIYVAFSGKKYENYKDNEKNIWHY